MPSPDSLPLDTDDLSDLSIFISVWRRALARQAQRLNDAGELVDGYFLVIAAHQLLLACRQYADHDPEGEVRGACAQFEMKHPNLTNLRNMLMHADEYYRGQGNIKESRGARTFTYSIQQGATGWQLSHGGVNAGQCNLTELTRDGLELASRVLAAPGPGESFREQLRIGGEYEGRGT